MKMEARMLYPRESETREVKDLGGVWRFRIDKGTEGLTQKWHEGLPLDHIPMPVPASYNDITEDAAIRDHVGWAWYERGFFVPSSWNGQAVVLRFGSVTHSALAWVNGCRVADHKGGYLPFEADITDLVSYDAENRLTVAANNVLDFTILPPGEMIRHEDRLHPPGDMTLEYNHDFFNYAGIHRPVRLLRLPRIRVVEIDVRTDFQGADGVVFFRIACAGDPAEVVVTVRDAGGAPVAEARGATGEAVIRTVHPWRPGDGYLYSLEVRLLDTSGELLDCYRLPFGVRTIKVEGKHFLINGVPFHFKGFGKHEDSDIRGKGLDEALNVKDFNLLDWIGANSFRTSHYPYSEEIMNMADERGIAVIDETTAVGMQKWGSGKPLFVPGKLDDRTLAHHLQVIRDLVARDKNHPSVVMWSVANEPFTDDPGAEPYFRRLAEVTRGLDSTRPVTFATCADYRKDCAMQFFDMVCVNRYYSWYSDPGRLELVEMQYEQEMRDWYERFGKPVLLSEYGADTVAGFHQQPPVMFSEEYQCAYLEAVHRALDRCDWVIGEHVWNFADFATKQDITRFGGNRKGVFTRQRQPKMSAHLLRKRWTGGT
jgi:beta-glucuronidase